MKKVCLFIAAVVLALASCDEIKKGPDGSENGDPDTPGEVVKPGGDGKEDDKDPIAVLTPDEQKVKLEEVAENLMDEYPATEFEEFFKLADSFAETYFDNVSDQYWDPFFEYCEERGEDMFFFEEKEEEKNGEIHRSWNMEAFLEFSDFHGLLTLGTTSATCEDYDGTKMVFSIGNDNYVVELTASGKVATAVYTYEDIYGYEDYNGYWDEQNECWVDEYVMVHGKDRYHFEVDVPEKINLSITKNGKDFASADFAFEQRFSAEGVNLTMDCFKVTATITIDDHSVIIERTGYDAATGKASLSYILKKGAKVIAKAELSGDVKVDLVTENDEWSSGYGTYLYPEFTIAKNFNVYLDVLGELQVKGNCTDVLSFAENVENFWDAENDTQAERAVDNMNNYIDLGIYYDKSSTLQADIVMDYYVEKDDYYGNTWYELEPVIVFSDGSKYAFYEYFDEDSFTGLESSFELWLELYETMLEHYFD